MLSRLDKEKSNVKDEPISFKVNRSPKISSNDHSISNFHRKSNRPLEAERTKSRNVELLLDSSIKNVKQMNTSLCEDESLESG